MYALLEDNAAKEVMALTSALQVVTKNVNPRRIGDNKAHQYDEDDDEDAVKKLKKTFQKLKIVARAKVNGDRVYSAAYHPEVSKDLVFFGGVLTRAVNPQVLKYPQTNMVNWGFGTLAPPLRKLKMTMTSRLLATAKVAATGGCSSTGLPHLDLQYRVSSSTQQTRTV